VKHVTKLFRVIIPVANIEEARAFYELVLDMPGERVSPGRHYFHCDGTVLACYDAGADGDAVLENWQPHPGQFVYFAVSNLDATHQKVIDAGGSVVEGGIQRMPWGERMLWAVDPFGNRISFVDESTVFTGTGL
jgi:predicted enzyme related to lactoylglutathione lyase